MKFFVLMSCLFFPFLWRGADVSAQCCSANPVAGSVNIGTLTKNTFRTITYYRYSFSDTYFDGDKHSDFNFVKNASYNFVSSILSYGVSNKITVETELGYYINKSEVFNTKPEYISKGWGFSNGVLSLKYGIFKKNEIELTAAAGAKFPFTRKQQTIDGVELPQTAQPSTGAFGFVGQFFISKSWAKKGLRSFLIYRTEINGTNSVEYKTGTSYSTSLFISKSMNYHWMGILQIRNESRERDVRENKTIAASGGTVFFVSPQINYTITQKWNISALVDFPVYRYYNGTQLSNKYAFSVNITKDF